MTNLTTPVKFGLIGGMVNNRRSGQVGLVLLVVMGVVMAIAMSLASRSLSDTVLSRQEQESSVAFRLAETGVESALNSIRTGSLPAGLTALPGSGIFSGNYGISQLKTLSLFVREGDVATLDLTGYNPANPLLIKWTRRVDEGENLTCVGAGSGLAPSALEVMTRQAAANTVTFNYYNPNGCAVAGNGFTVSSAGSGDYRSQVSFSVPVGTTGLRLRPLYADATVAVEAVNLPATQLYLIESKAEGGDAKKEIQVTRGLDAAPSIFDYALFSGSTIVK